MTRVYIVLPKWSQCVQRRVPTSRAVPSHWHSTPAAAWAAHLSAHAPEWIIVGGDISSGPNAHGAHEVRFDWSDTHTPLPGTKGGYSE